jgi:hypothetical protein
MDVRPLAFVRCFYGQRFAVFRGQTLTGAGTMPMASASAVYDLSR